MSARNSGGDMFRLGIELTARWAFGILTVHTRAGGPGYWSELPGWAGMQVGAQIENRD